jgi:hypothetical protein
MHPNFSSCKRVLYRAPGSLREEKDDRNATGERPSVEALTSMSEDEQRPLDLALHVNVSHIQVPCRLVLCVSSVYTEL